MHLNSSGQSQLLSVIILGNVMLAMLLGVMEYSNQVRQVAIKESRVTEMRKALDASNRLVLQLYRESVCDPVALNNKINFLNVSGQQSGAIGQRQVNFQVNGRDYLVSIGPVSRLPWTVLFDPSMPAAGPGEGEDIVGVSQDAVVEVWTHSGGTRVSQKAALLNNCAYPCAYIYGGTLNAKMGMCAIAADPIVGYHMVNPASSGVYSPDTAAGTAVHPAVPQTYGTANTPAVVKDGNYYPGNVSISIGGDCGTEDNEPVLAGTFTGSSRLDVRDLTIFRDYLRSGNKNATCDARVQDSDLNADGIINENDLVILEKFLRGYIYQIPVAADSVF
ncbi:MAG: hypothetical protein KA715_14115 [Xanthomonadaceae bacterium]|nr:hypothetical protein [Xanthomonadaceae bacterium]